jgi:iron complex transport system ATP-binding protein
MWQATGLTFSYPSLGRQVIAGLDLTVEGGTFLGVIGPNGSGKTTLLDLLSGILTAHSGRVLLNGQDVAAMHARKRARLVAIVPQDFSIRFDFTVRQVVEMGRHPWLRPLQPLSRTDRRIVEEVMVDLDIARLATRPVTRLSGGERQRVAVARALAQTTRALILDEATSNLDIYHSLAIMEAVKRRVDEQGLTVVAAIHDVNLAATYCSRLAYLTDGRLLAEGPSSSLLDPGLLGRLFGVEASVRDDDFVGARQVSFRLPGKGRMENHLKEAPLDGGRR